MDWVALHRALAFTGPAGVTPNCCYRNLCTDFDYILVLSGSGSMDFNGRRHRVRRGTALFCRPGEYTQMHQDPKSPRLLAFFVHFTLKKLAHRKLEGMPGIVQMHDAPTAEARALSLRQAFRNDTPGEIDLAGALLLSLLMQMVVDSRSRPPKAIDTQLHRICFEIDTAPQEDWKVPDLARQAGLSHSQFNRRFRTLTKVSPIRYIINRRIDRAKWLLLKTDINFKKIAMELGYSEIAHFYNQFRRETGLTPSDFRTGKINSSRARSPAAPLRRKP